MPITWQNINAPDFRASMLGMGQASQSLNTAGAQLQQLIANQGKLNNENWDNQARINTNTMIGESEAAANLGAFHAQDPNYDIGSGQDRFGAQVDMAAVAEGRAATLAKLQGLAGNAATTEANTVFDTDQSAAAAGQAFKNSILSQGGTEEEANAGAVDYMKKGLALKQAAVAEQNDKTSNDLLASMDFSGGDPVALKQQAREQIGDPNFDYSTIDKGIDAGVNQTNDVVDRAAILKGRRQEETDTTLRGDILDQVFKADPNTDPVMLARNLATQSKMSQPAWTRLQTELNENMKLRPDQEAALTVYGGQATQKLNELTSALTAEKTKIETPTDPMQKAPYDGEFAKTAVAMGIKEPGGLFAAMGKLADSRGITGFFANESYRNAAKAGLIETKKELTQENIPADAADILVLKAFNNIGGTSYGGWGKAGIDIAKLKEQALALGKQYKEHEKFQLEIQPKVKAIDEQILKATSQTKSLLEQAMLGTMRSNLRGTTYALPEIK